MAAVGTDKELSDLLDFSMVSEGARRGGGGGALKGPGLWVGSWEGEEM